MPTKTRQGVNPQNTYEDSIMIVREPAELAYLSDQERIEQADDARMERRTNGATDATFQRLPEYADEDYLAGYIEQLQTFATGPNGRVIYPQLPSHGAFGRIDGDAEYHDQFSEF